MTRAGAHEHVRGADMANRVPNAAYSDPKRANEGEMKGVLVNNSQANGSQVAETQTSQSIACRAAV